MPALPKDQTIELFDKWLMSELFKLRVRVGGLETSTAMPATYVKLSASGSTLLIEKG